MEQYQSDNQDFNYLGSENCELRLITESSFVIKQHHMPLFIEFSFDGEILRTYPSYEAFEEAFGVKGMYTINQSKNKVISVYGENYNIYNNTRSLVAYNGISDSESEQSLLKSCQDLSIWKMGTHTLKRYVTKQGLDLATNFIMLSDVEPKGIISTMKFDCHKFDDGDSGTAVCVLDQKNILIANDGDCPSVLLIKTNITIDPIREQLMSSLLNASRNYKKWNQDIIDMIYEFYDSKTYNVYELPDSYYVCMKDDETRKIICKIAYSNSIISFQILSKSEKYFYTNLSLNNPSYEDVEGVKQLIETHTN